MFAKTEAPANATDTIPIVMAIVSDPVALGRAASLARQGGNLTGFTGMSSELPLDAFFGSPGLRRTFRRGTNGSNPSPSSGASAANSISPSIPISAEFRAVHDRTGTEEGAAEGHAVIRYEEADPYGRP